MTIRELAIVSQTKLIVKLNTGTGLYQARLIDAVTELATETKDSMEDKLLRGEYGVAETKIDALIAYCAKISNRILVVSSSGKRRYYPLPEIFAGT